MDDASAANSFRMVSFAVLVVSMVEAILSLSIVAMLEVPTLLRAEVEVAQAASEHFWVPH